VKKLAAIAVTFAALVATSPAMAADLPAKAPPVYAPPPPAYTWTGCYIGGNLGVGKQDTAIFDPQLQQSGGTSNGIGLIGGGQVGCDYQFSGNWVVGVRGMFDGAAIKQSEPWPTFSEETLGINTNWIATALGRVGYSPGPNLLLYVKGGAAWKHVSYTDDCPTCSYAGNGSATILGWDVGAGFEYAFLPNLSAFAELDYMGFPSTATTLTYTASTPELASPYTYDYTHDILAILVGVNWRFHP